MLLYGSDRTLSYPCLLQLILVRQALEQQRCGCLIVSALDEIAYLFNLRGGDIDYNPGLIGPILVAAPSVDVSLASLFSFQGICDRNSIERPLVC